VYPWNLIGHGVVVVADGPGDFPRAVFVLPQVNEFSFADWLGILVAWVVEAVNTHFDCAVAFHVMDL